MTARRATIRMADLRRAARIAGETGQVVTVQVADTTYRIAPPGATVPLGSESEVVECDKTFGLSG